MEMPTEQNQPLVSVITPAYNSERFMEDAIESVQRQTYTKWEMIIVDDGSSDRTPEIIKTYQKKDDRIQLIQLKKNSGPAVARNIAFEHARGRYLAFLDADDQWMPNKLERQLQFMQQRQIAFSFTKYIKIKSNGRRRRSVVRIPDCVNYERLLKHNVIGCLTVMLDTAIIGEVKMINIRSRQDYALWLALCKRGFPAYGLQEELAVYRVVKNSVSSNKLKMARQNWKIYREIIKLSLMKSVWYFMNNVYFSIKKHLT